MSKTIATENAPAAIGPYVQGVDLGSMVITSGQIPVDPKTGAVAEDVSAQARQSLENVKAIVEAAGLKVGDIVKTTVFVKDLNDFATVNATYEAFFTEHNATFPARSSSLSGTGVGLITAIPFNAGAGGTLSGGSFPFSIQAVSLPTRFCCASINSNAAFNPASESV